MAFFQPLHNFDFTDIDYNLQPHTIGLLLIGIVIVVILLITSLYLYYYFVSRYGNLTIPTTTTTTTTTANFSSSSPHVMAQSMGLDSATINKLPTFLHRSLPSSKKEEQTECSICLGVFEDEERIKVLPKCQHVYHTQCVDKWLSTQSSCPLCRATVQVLQSTGEFAVIQM